MREVFERPRKSSRKYPRPSSPVRESLDLSGIVATRKTFFDQWIIQSLGTPTKFSSPESTMIYMSGKLWLWSQFSDKTFIFSFLIKDVIIKDLFVTQPVIWKNRLKLEFRSKPAGLFGYQTRVLAPISFKVLSNSKYTSFIQIPSSRYPQARNRPTSVSLYTNR